MGISVESTEWLLLHCFQVELEFENFGFCGGRKTGVPEKNPWGRNENQQQTQPTYDAETGNRTRTTLVGGECSHHCTIPVPSVQPKFCLRFHFYCLNLKNFCSVGLINRELKQLRRQRQRERQLEMQLRLTSTTSRLFQFVQLVQCRHSIQELD